MCVARTVQTCSALIEAVADLQISNIYVANKLVEVPTIHLSPGQKLIGVTKQAALHFASGGDGVLLSADNEVKNLKLISDLDRRVIFSAGSDLYQGSLVLTNLDVMGRIQIFTTDSSK